LQHNRAKIDSLVFSGAMEQWRTGNNAVVEDTPFEFSLDATSLTDGTWVSASSFEPRRENRDQHNERRGRWQSRREPNGDQREDKRQLDTAAPQCGFAGAI